MSGKKKKVSTCISKQNEAHHKNVFYSKVIQIAKMVSQGDAYKLLTNDFLHRIYVLRTRPIRIVLEEGAKISQQEFWAQKNTLLDLFKNETLLVKGKNYQIGLHDCMGPGISLWMHLKLLKENRTSERQNLVKAFGEFIDSDEFYNNTRNGILNLTDFISGEVSSFDKRIVTIKVEYKKDEINEYAFYYKATFRVFVPQMIHVVFDGRSRPAFRVGLTLNGEDPDWINIKAGVMKLNQMPEDKLVPVYIQHHAMIRLRERLDCSCNALILLDLAASLYKPKCILYHGNRLLEFISGERKIGYLVLDWTKEGAILRTFLLLTHTDTPEGDKLQNIMGFEKPDIPYLNLDKLSTFVYSDLRDHPHLCDLFKRAGCEALLEIKKMDPASPDYIMAAAFIESYHRKNQDYKNQIKTTDSYQEF
jgi:hypothetical protein